ncbi:sulfotransferase [Dongia deserti]|uniref:sulfotransferase n=1 Tax=Dongia deserti TaxID=2268030 RepID=UPI0013C450DA|nr:sulfotransferase [Dongia deserti]
MDDRHVFVSGLARAGTTIIMRRLHETGMFRSLTYRDMPFVLCPDLWARLSAHSRRNIDAVERAHGDRLQVDADSPEALDEVFWRVFAGVDYIKPDHLCAHAADAELIEKFRLYISCILRPHDGRSPQKRYLSKNNNNILRLNTLQAAFPEAVILIPFRDPLQHAISLLNQHAKFCTMQKESRFVRSYMTWLAHHEFGLEHKPFWFDTKKPFEKPTHPESSINYWLETWLRTYRRIHESRPANSLLVCYEDLCSDPAVWSAILERLGIENRVTDPGQPFSRAENRTAPDIDMPLLERARGLYGALRQDSAHALGRSRARQ